MLIFKKTAELQDFLQSEKAKDKRIGFVPTMGALHDGHLSLIAQSTEKANLTACSIFVNPTQFDEQSDLDKYPRTLAEDIAILEGNKCDVLFLPSVEEVYPPNAIIEANYDFGYLDQSPWKVHIVAGHFRGVAQVVNRLLEIVQPHQLFMGQKDYQTV